MEQGGRHLGRDRARAAGVQSSRSQTHTKAVDPRNNREPRGGSPPRSPSHCNKPWPSQRPAGR
eukprot:4725446-Alexandrium_andersonii.AAC.1